MTTRQELYDRIRETSRDEVILDEMIRLGFWPRETSIPGDPADEIRQRGELERELRALTSENKRLQDAEAIKRALRKQRMEEARRKRQETKERRLRERQERAEAWRARMRTEISFLGTGVSCGLQDHDSDTSKLARYELPALSTPADVAKAMGITINELRFLAFNRRTSKTNHYQRFGITKKTGGIRHISAPMPRLKRTQHWILENILERIPLHPAAHGFRRGRSIVTNALPHVGKEVVVNVDLENFFPTISYRRVKGVFRSFGYSESVTTVLALLCCEPDVSRVSLDGETYFVAEGERFLPQGAPTSPAITNIICRGLDARLHQIAEQLGFQFTRYADDVTFSGADQPKFKVGTALRRIRHVVADEGFRIHPDKTRILRKGRRQEVTGLTVNGKLGVARSLLRRFRATLFQIEKDGPAGKRWGSSSDVIASIEGFANFVFMVDNERGRPLQQQVDAIIDKYGRGSQRTPQRIRYVHTERSDQAAGTEEGSRSGAAPATETSNPQVESHPPKATESESRKPWWKFW